MKMDEALLTVYNLLPDNITVLYVSDYCYKVLFGYLSLSFVEVTQINNSRSIKVIGLYQRLFALLHAELSSENVYWIALLTLLHYDQCFRNMDSGTNWVQIELHHIGYLFNQALRCGGCKKTLLLIY